MLDFKTLLRAGILCGLTATAQAALVVSNDLTLIYDPGNNLTWTSDANLLASLESKDANLVSTIISDVVSISDTNGANLLVGDDFGANGLVDWYGAQAFVAYLNLIAYQGSSHWILPTTVDADSSAGEGVKTSQLGDLFYNELGGKADHAIPDNQFFTNQQSFGYWSGTEYSSNPYDAWTFSAANGTQATSDKANLFYAWAVSSGNVGDVVVPTAVPIPGAVWLFASAVLGCLGFRRTV